MNHFEQMLCDQLFAGKITQWEMVAIAQAVEEYQGTKGVMPQLDKALADIKSGD